MISRVLFGVLSSFVILLFVSVPVLAQSNGFVQKADEYYSYFCYKNTSSRTTGAVCLLLDHVTMLDLEVAELSNRMNTNDEYDKSQDELITDLEAENDELRFQIQELQNDMASISAKMSTGSGTIKNSLNLKTNCSEFGGITICITPAVDNL